MHSPNSYNLGNFIHRTSKQTKACSRFPAPKRRLRKLSANTAYESGCRTPLLYKTYLWEYGDKFLISKITGP